MAEQIQAITGRRIRPGGRMRAMIEAEGTTELFAARERRQAQEESAGLQARSMTLQEEAAKTQEKQAERASKISMIGTGAMIGGSIGGPVGAGVGAVAGLVASFF